MKDPWLREMTASEPLTLQEEYENQISWFEDETKLTFILCQRENQKDDVKNLDHIVGDCNIFLTDEEGMEGLGEIEIMIAEARARGKGIATEALNLLMSYCLQELKLKGFIAKISNENEPSKKLFRSIGYTQVGEPNYFNEVLFRLDETSPRWKEIFSNQVVSQPYDA
eukprot:TRINITY_DN2826_c0_g3_i3.p1 TRINITY_DN2826_c0_g3~~TRINITY_DN2826_c0_g3_i3.p1  ORF type:complete len:168 (+),score=36.08 TRINITY_DN2826_c0_g3_i3:119-622(+)